MVRLNFVGDIALFKEFQDRNIDPFKLIVLPESDYNIGNFEFIIPLKRDKYFFDVSDQYAVGYDYFTSLELNRFNAFSMANNHCMDYGWEGLEDVIKVFEKKGISSFGVGSDEFNILKFELNGISFAIIAVVKSGRWSRSAEIPSGPDPYNIDAIIEKIRYLKSSTNHVIVFPHFGTELVDIPDPDDVKNARLMIDNGATAVIGHHPHIIQGIENYKNGIIAYSLGSFIYIPENEGGYSRNQSKNRNFSICLNLSFNKDGIASAEPVFYRYDEKSSIPLLFEGRIPYFDEVNNLVNNSKAYYSRIRKELLSRELTGFYQRFKKNPFKTIKHYLSYLKFKHIKKILS